MFETILIPTDGSEYAESAAETGFELASRHDATVHVICVAETGPLSDIRLPGDSTNAKEAIHGQAERFVSRIAERAQAYDLEVTTVVREGPPETEILEYGEEIGADLIVMGTRGRGGIHRMAVGSVADHVIRFGDIQVLIAKHRSEEQ
ncbi:universal stress protein [Natronoglomus mannanivorans]|uniref:Universal stress protein n=1 Tax=Natronoglomus mannanivorans TaxID=2979990 RepID=A0AAP2YYV3_9EURY|nr:universal stress protein [Halobacteria archaeon AArc-xg1-1]